MQSLKNAEVVKKMTKTKDVSTMTTTVTTKTIQVQTDHYEELCKSVNDLKDQVQQLSEMLSDIAEDVKARRVETVKDCAVLAAEVAEVQDDVMFDEDSENSFVNSSIESTMNYILSPEIAPNPPLQQFVPLNRPVETSTPPLLQYVVPQRPIQTPRAPLNDILNLTESVTNGPTDEQRRKVSRLVDFGVDMNTAAIASVDVLFTEQELASSNTSGSKGFEQLDASKISFLNSQLKRKFNNPHFSDQWEVVLSKINSKCRGKRRTLITKLKKQCQ